jgi:hypothetical protein
MPYEVRLTHLQGKQAEFEKAVADHITALHAFSKEVGKPRPVHHPLVEAAIKRVQKANHPDEYVADYTILDDSPPPPTLEEKKAAHYADLLKAENVAKTKIIPNRKIRLMSLANNAALQKIDAEKTDQDKEAMASYIKIAKAFQKIEWATAQAESDIEDLTEANVDSWQVPALGEPDV